MIKRYFWIALIFTVFSNSVFAKLLDAVFMEGYILDSGTKVPGFVTIKSPITNKEFLVPVKWLEKKVGRSIASSKKNEPYVFFMEVPGKDYRAMRSQCVGNKKLRRSKLDKLCVPRA